MADLLDTIRRDIDARLGELRPLAQEAANLEAALAALDGVADEERNRGRGVLRVAAASPPMVVVVVSRASS
jgi:hypothetical protein